MIRYLYQSKKWVLVYLNDDGLIFIRPTTQNSNLVKQLRIDLDKWEINKAQIKKIGLRQVSPLPHLRLAQILYALGADQKAQLQAKEALDILPSSAKAYVILGEIYLKKGNLDRAYQYLRLASIYAPNGVSTLLALGDYYLKVEDNKSVEKVYKKIIEISPRYAQGYYNLGKYYESSGDLKKAIKYFRKAAKLAPYSTQYLDKFNEVSAKINSSYLNKN